MEPRRYAHALKREGIQVARCSVERNIGELGLQGARRGRGYVRTTIPSQDGRSPGRPGETRLGRQRSK